MNESIVGTTTRIFYSSPTFSAGKIRVNGKEHSFAGACSLEEGETVTLTGEWVTDPKWGRQFKVKEYDYEVPPTADGLAIFLSRSKEFSGIGEVRARSIAQHFGASFEEALTARPEEIASVARVSLDVVERLKQSWFDDRERNQVFSKLAEYSVGIAASKSLYARYRSSIIKIIEKNPYFLIGKVARMGFRTVDKIALASGHPKTSVERLRAGVEFCLSEDARDGHTWITEDDLKQQSMDALALDSLDTDEIVDAVIDELVENGTFVRIYMPEQTAVMSVANHRAERDVLSAFLKHGRSDGVFSGENIPEEVYAKDEDDIAPHEEQRKAIWTALTSRMSIITGGAGVGKTFCLQRIAMACAVENVTMAFCAPTGKAAQRIQDSTGYNATTIHVLLEPRPSEGEHGERQFHFSRNSENKLEAEFICVDEVSMVDSSLMASLFRAIDFARTSIVFMGDHNQLPPVGAGNVLRDALAQNLCPIARLTKVHRQAGELKEKTNKILSGVVFAGHEKDGRPSDGDELKPWYLLGNLDSATSVAQTVERLFRESISLYRVNGNPIDRLKDLQILTPMHKGECGTVELNRRLQRAWHELNGRTVDQKKALQIVVGDKVIQTKNDYDLNVMNGTLGVVVEQRKDAKSGKRVWTIDFDGREVEIEGDRTYKIQLAYALTIHKVQGSEFPVSVIVCHRSQRYMHHRGLLYTGVSRSTHSSIILGDARSIKACAKKVVSDRRRTVMMLEPDVARVVLGVDA